MTAGAGATLTLKADGLVSEQSACWGANTRPHPPDPPARKNSFCPNVNRWTVLGGSGRWWPGVGEPPTRAGFSDQEDRPARGGGSGAASAHGEQIGSRWKGLEAVVSVCGKQTVPDTSVLLVPQACPPAPRGTAPARHPSSSRLPPPPPPRPPGPAGAVTLRPAQAPEDLGLRACHQGNRPGPRRRADSKSKLLP